jgi:hypothetical protein
MKSPYHWATHLPEPIKMQFLRNLNVRYFHYKDYSKTIAEAIETAFAWDETPEGESYWGDIFDRASNGEFDTPIINSTTSVAKQTAVEYLIQNIEIALKLNGVELNHMYRMKTIYPVYNQAKAMEKEQMIKFAFDFYYKHSKKMGVPFNLISENRINAEQYYNENYGGDK